MAVSSLRPVGASNSEMLERWFFSVIAGALLLIAIVGFAPNSIAIINGSKTNPEFAVHIHAAAMVSWMLLFFIQANLILKGNKKLHTNVGRALFLLGPIIVLLMVYLAITRFPEPILSMFKTPLKKRIFKHEAIDGRGQAEVTR